MPTPLRAFQSQLEREVYLAWQAGHRNVLVVSATGSGKTVVISKIMYDYAGRSVAIAHRRELVSQISVALARNGVRHRILAPRSVQKEIASLHMLEVGRNYIDPNAKAAVGGVDTIINLKDPAQLEFLRSCGLWVQDEAHHVLVDNKWGAAITMVPNAFGLGVTATPGRADGKGLGRHADGVFDHMVEAPTMRDLINMGYLTDYRIIAPPSDLDLSSVPVGASGEFVQVKLADAVHKSHITGDVVQSYLKYAAGKLGVTFAVDVQSATAIAAAFREAGVPAEVISAKTPDGLRLAVLRRFKNREVLQLVNVDLFGEGFDLPAIEVVSMARPTNSFTLYAQQFGRACRLMISPELLGMWEHMTPERRRAEIAESGKPTAIIIDHVKNWERHNGPPDRPRVFTLDRRQSGRRGGGSRADDVIPMRTCGGCAGIYERVYSVCPYCGEAPVYGSRSSPAMVDGDLAELDPDFLAFLRGELAKGDSGYVITPAGAAPEVAGRLHRLHHERHAAQQTLRQHMMLWGGYETALGRDIPEAQRRFYFKYGIDVLSAQLLGRADAEALTARIAIDNAANRH
jgi:superfamily II DNA or RNA helicase